MQTKEEVYNQATLENLGNNPNGTRMDIIYDAMDKYAVEYHAEQIKKKESEKYVPLSLFLESVDEYLVGQRTHQLKRDASTMSTIECVADWCKKFAKNLAK